MSIFCIFLGLRRGPYFLVGGKLEVSINSRIGIGVSYSILTLTQCVQVHYSNKDIYIFVFFLTSCAEPAGLILAFTRKLKSFIGITTLFYRPNIDRAVQKAALLLLKNTLHTLKVKARKLKP